MSAKRSYILKKHAAECHGFAYVCMDVWTPGVKGLTSSNEKAKKAINMDAWMTLRKFSELD